MEGSCDMTPSQAQHCLGWGFVAVGLLTLCLCQSTLGTAARVMTEHIVLPQVFILDSLITYQVQDSKDAEKIVERVLPRLQHVNSAVVLSAAKVWQCWQRLSASSVRCMRFGLCIVCASMSMAAASAASVWQCIIRTDPLLLLSIRHFYTLPYFNNIW